MRPNKLFAIFFVVTFHACYYDVEEELFPVEPIGDVTYTEDIEPVIKSSCAIQGCHVQGGIGVGVFDTYQAVKRKVDEGSFRKRVVELRNMPPNGLPPIELQKIEIWLNDGAPNN